MKIQFKKKYNTFDSWNTFKPFEFDHSPHHISPVSIILCNFRVMAGDIKEGRPLVFETPDALESAIQAYFDKQIEDGLPITISGLAYSLGFASRQSIYDYKDREEFSYILKRATFFVESQYENKLSGTTPTGAIFALKNMGWRDKVETGFTDGEGKDVQPQIIFNAAPNCQPLVDPDQPVIEHKNAGSA